MYINLIFNMQSAFMKKLLIITILSVSVTNISLAQTPAKTTPVATTSSPEQVAKKEADKWAKALELTAEQKQNIYVICLTFAIQNAEIEKNGGKVPPGPNSEKDNQIQTILNQDQFREYRKIVNKEMPVPPPVKKAPKK